MESFPLAGSLAVDLFSSLLGWKTDTGMRPAEPSDIPSGQMGNTESLWEGGEGLGGSSRVCGCTGTAVEGAAGRVHRSGSGGARLPPSRLQGQG